VLRGITGSVAGGAVALRTMSEGPKEACRGSTVSI
jgi:hypothetical protein